MMSNHLAWRRCAACGQLTLVPATAESCWQCGAPLVSRPEASDDQSAANPRPGSHPAGSAFGGFGAARASAAGAASPADLNLPPPRPRFMDLTAADDIVARRLLESVFPHGVDL